MHPHTTRPLSTPFSQPHAIATFNMLVAEGRRVAVGLISRSPMTRADASSYAPDWARRESEADVSLRAVLRRREDGEEGQRLLGAGDEQPSGVGEASGAQQRPRAAGASAAADRPVQPQQPAAIAERRAYGETSDSPEADVPLSMTDEERRAVAEGRGKGGERVSRRSDELKGRKV